MDFAIDRQTRAVRVEQDRGVPGFVFAGSLLGDRSCDQVDSELMGEPRHERKRRAVERFSGCRLVDALAAPVEDLRQRHQVRAARRGQADETLRALEVVRLVGGRAHLDRCGQKGHGGSGSTSSTCFQPARGFVLPSCAGDVWKHVWVPEPERIFRFRHAKKFVDFLSCRIRMPPINVVVDVLGQNLSA